MDIAAGQAKVSNAEVRRWVEEAATSTSRYYGRFPVKVVDITVTADGDGAVDAGKQVDGRYIQINLGSDTTPKDLRDDWTMTHEMFHLAFPDLDDRHHWMNEGLSTYLEPIARARAGILETDEFWKEAVEGMPKGEPAAGDRGLDLTHSWGRTYWGGAMFWLVADVNIRRATNGRKSLDDATRAILDAGGDGSVTWPVEKVLRVGDEAAGTTALNDLYAQQATHAATVDLAALWKELGVVYSEGKITYDDAAPLAAARRAMTAAARNPPAHSGK